MAVCSPQDLISANPCLSSLSPHMLEVLITQQLCSLFNKLDSGAAVTCDIQTLLADAECFANLSINELKILQAQLLCNILPLV
jgi:hypothetical protein